MSIRKQVEEAMKTAMRERDSVRLDCLRMIKGALLHKEKEKGEELGEEAAMAVLRAEARKRQQSLGFYREHNKPEEAAATEAEIRVIEEFLPQQLTPEQTEEKVRAFLAEHPDVTHAGKLTGMLKKELGEQVDGKVLNDVCRRVLEG